MWARRLGVPPTWPSRVKVFLYSLGTGAIGWTIYTFMASSNVGYLDLSKPSQDNVLCVASWPGTSASKTWFNEQDWGDWLEYQSDMSAYLRRYTCAVPSVKNVTCAAVNVPLHRLDAKLGAPLRLGDGSYDWRKSFVSKDALSIYSHLFLVLSVCLWLAISCHDHALLHTVNKNYILDLQGVAREFPRFHMACGYIMGNRAIRGLLCGHNSCLRRLAGLSMALLVVPVLLVWRFLLFMFVICPLSGFLFFVYPIRTSRLWTFLICIVSMVYGVCLSVHMLTWALSENLRPRYAVHWNAEATSMAVVGGSGECNCGCDFPLSETTVMRLFMIGLLATVKSFIVAFRCLKGLRRSNWANLMSVTFTVPVNAYSVEWTQPDGNAIKNRKEGQPVQSELAFDPFALMDEQPESANTHVSLKPSSVLSWEVDESSGLSILRQISKRNLMGPCAPIYEDLESVPMHSRMDLQPMEYIGCCGFPCRTGGIQGRLSGGVSDPSIGGKSRVSSPDRVRRGVSRVPTVQGELATAPGEVDLEENALSASSPSKDGTPRSRIGDFLPLPHTTVRSLKGAAHAAGGVGGGDGRTPKAGGSSREATPRRSGAIAEQVGPSVSRMWPTQQDVSGDLTLPRLRLSTPDGLPGSAALRYGVAVASPSDGSSPAGANATAVASNGRDDGCGREARLSKRLPPAFFPVVTKGKMEERHNA